jgi:predicted aldo/keto reductase-like oxidoreductase
VAIPRILEMYNEAVIYRSPDKGRLFYSWLEPEQRADQCVECGECEEKCPQKIEIIAWLKKVHEALGAGTAA